MSDTTPIPPLPDQGDRDRFRDEWSRNFAVSANAGSGKTTAISERLAAMALAPGGAELLKKTAVVTFARKAAAQIGARAREVLLKRLVTEGRTDLTSLDHLERAFFGTIHSFCLLLAQRYGQTLGINLNPAVVAENDDALWEEFLEQDSMQFTSLEAAQVDAFLRHTPLETVFDLARELGLHAARRFVGRSVAPQPPEPSAEALSRILTASTNSPKGAAALKHNQETAVEWRRRFREEKNYLPLPKPEGKAAGIDELFADYFAPVKSWLAAAGATLAGELALRYRAWRFDRGVQTYADQVEAALAVLQDAGLLEKIRAEGWRVILDEAQDTDPQQFAVLVEIARPPGAELGAWPNEAARGDGPRAGHFCMVGDGQQAIYGSRADIRNFQKHLEAFRRGDGGELLTFGVTFRAPLRVIELLNATLPAAFGAGRAHNLGLPPVEGAPAPLRQVRYEALLAGPQNVAGAAGVLPLVAVAGEGGVKEKLAAEVRQIAVFLKAHGAAGVGAGHWGEVCLLAPRNDWLMTARKELEKAGLKVALQMRKNRNGDNPAYAWVCGLFAALGDPDNLFEWTGVLREVFAVSDAQIAEQLRAEKKFHWAEPERHPEPMRGALAVLKPFVERVDAEGDPLEKFATDLAAACGLAERARLIDPSGALNGELERLLAEAAELGLEGAGPRAWLRELLAKLDDGRPTGKPSDDALNLLTAHSAKGLEWPVVIPLGLWRKIGKPPETGLRLVADASGAPQVYFDGASLPDAAKDARERERLRELVRLLYVTLTRPRRALVLPWGAEFSVAGAGSFAELWGASPGDIAVWTPPADLAPAFSAGTMAEEKIEVAAAAVDASAFPAGPTRLLPHQLAQHVDLPRTARHESASDEPVSSRGREDPIDYGVWWHETVEFVEWRADDQAVEQHLAESLAKAQRLGFDERGARELALLKGSPLWRELRDPRWHVLAELSVTAPLRAEAWVDGVIDLVAHDAATGELLVIDWKTNRHLSGESVEALLARLLAEYRPQLEAYGACLAQFFPGQSIRLGVYASGAGEWRAL